MKAYSLDLRQRIVATLKAGEKKNQVALLFKVSLSTVKRLWKRQTEGSDLAPLAPPGRPPLIRPDQYASLAQQVKLAPDRTQAEYAQFWQQHHQVRASQSTLSRTLARMKVSRKKKTLQASERDETKRATFRAKQADLDPTKLVVLDETATNLGLTSLYGYSPIGERVYGSVPRNYGKNLTMLAALTLAGMPAETAVFFEGGTDRLTFELYIRDFLCPTLSPGQIVILDNLAAHDSAEVRAAIEACQCEVLFLPPYSPDLSPIELAFSKIKQYLRQVGARTRQALEEALQQALTLITPQDAEAYFKHCGYSLAVQ
jgi:transposase